MTTETQTHSGHSDAPPISNIPEAVNVEDMRPVALPENITQLKPEQLVLDDDMQVRRFMPSAKDVESLAHDIVRQGQLYPILYRVVGERNIVIDGATRVRAIAYVNEHKLTDRRLKVNAMLVDMSDVEAFTAGAAANIKRFGMSPIDHARVITTLTQTYGMTKTDAGKVLGRSPAWVSEISRMAELRAGVQKKIHEGKIGYTTAREMLDWTDEEQDEFIADMEKSNVGGKSKRGSGKSREAARAKTRAKNQAKGGGQSDQKVSLTLKEAREMFASLAGVGKDAEAAKAAGEKFECKYTEKVQTVALACMKALDGKLGEKALANKIDAA